MRHRVIGYIDGYNLYHGLRDAAYRRYYWLNVSALCRALLKPDQDLVYTKYFTSRVSGPPETVKRQTTFIEAIASLPDLSVYFGQYDGEKFNCGRCGHPETWHNEKMTDVNIALEVAKDAYADKFDVALLITGDADQTPTVRMIRDGFTGKRAVCAFPPRRVSKQLKQYAHGHVHINENNLRSSLFPREVISSNGYRLCCPSQWT